MNQWVISADKEKLLIKTMRSSDLENIILEMKNLLDEFFSILVTVEENINQLENRQEKLEIEAQRKRKLKKSTEPPWPMDSIK